MSYGLSSHEWDIVNHAIENPTERTFCDLLSLFSHSEKGITVPYFVKLPLPSTCKVSENEHGQYSLNDNWYAKISVDHKITIGQRHHENVLSLSYTMCSREHTITGSINQTTNDGDDMNYIYNLISYPGSDKLHTISLYMLGGGDGILPYMEVSLDVDGKLDGFYVSRDEEGKIIEKQLYKNGKKFELKTDEELFKLIDEHPRSMVIMSLIARLVEKI